MECTQRIECTQDVYDVVSEKTCPEQIGFLGICGSKYPVKKGPNKIGRDPQTCSIVLNENSISRQHAVINILNKTNFMLMDLDSSNKTKLMNMTLQPYIPHPIKNGDTVQFGQVFGIFRLLEEVDDLPMTQDVNIPETPVNSRHVSRMNNVPITMIPESPDVSDRDDSIIAQSQTNKRIGYKSPNNNFIKSSGKIIGIQPVGTNRIDNVYWNSSKKSDSFSSHFEGNLDQSTVNKASVSSKKDSINQNNIFDLETQQPPNCIDDNQTSVSIHDANTQVPNIVRLPEVYKVQDQNNVQLNLYATDKKNTNIYDAETQVILEEKEKRQEVPSTVTGTGKPIHEGVCSRTNQKLNSSDEEICFDDVDSHPLDDNYGSQPILQSDSCNIGHLTIHPAVTNQENQKRNNIQKNKNTSNINLNDSDGSTDCEDEVPVRLSQRDTEKPHDDEDVTDCEDNMIELNVKSTESNNLNKNPSDDDITDCEDDIIEISQNRSKVSNSVSVIVGDKEPRKSDNIGVPFEDMLTQVIDICPSHDNVNQIPKDKSVPFEDLQTQVIDVIPEIPQSSKDTSTDLSSPFKVPSSKLRLKRKETIINNSTCTPVLKETDIENKEDDNENYYAATQQIYDDLCSQNELIKASESKQNNNESITDPFVRGNSSDGSDGVEKIKTLVSNMSKEQIREVIGVDVASITKKGFSDSSDSEGTPKKCNPSKFLMIDLPNSQDIKSCKFVSTKVHETDSSDGFEESEEQDDTQESTSVGFRGKKRRNVKQDLSKKFDVDTLPTRAITRIRKPPSKILSSDDTSIKMSEKILQSKLGLDNKHEIDNEVIQFNLARLRNKVERAKNKRSSNHSDQDVKDIKLHNIQVPSRQESHLGRHNEQKLLQNNEKELKQQDISSMFKEARSKRSKPLDVPKVNTESSESSTRNRRSSRNKNSENSKKIVPIVEQGSSGSRNGRKRTYSRKHSREKEIETFDLTIDSEPVLRRSKRHQAIKDKNEDKDEKTRKSKKKKDSDKTDKVYTISSRSSRNGKSSNYELSVSSGKAVGSPANSERKSSGTHPPLDKMIIKITPKNKNEYNIEKPRNAKQKKESKSEKNTVTSETKRNNKSRNHEESALNKPTLESSASHRGFKRPANSDISPPQSKRAKLSDVTSNRATSTRGIRTHSVLMTAFYSDEVKDKLEKLGAVIVSDVKSCTVVLTKHIKRTFKLLCAVGLGKPIVGTNWVQACSDANMIVDPWLYVIKDEDMEKLYKFNLRQSLTGKRNFLKGYNVSCTPHALPNGDDMKGIIECSGGRFREGGESWLCVSCLSDELLWPALRRRGAKIVKSEIILTGVLRQKLDLSNSEPK